MTIKIDASELLSAATLGALFGIMNHASHLKWHGLGRDAYLANQSQYYEKFCLNPPSAMHSILIGGIIALFAFAAYRGLILLYGKLLSAIPRKNEDGIVQP